METIRTSNVRNRDADVIEKINVLRKKKNAVILAHYYQDQSVQDIADYVGDSLGLSQQAAATQADVIVFAGVYFMAETAKIINPSRKVLLPDLNAGCSLADSCTANDILALEKAHPDHRIISYVNCSAEVKALSDIICTSANAEAVIRSFPAEVPLIFVPDRNLGQYLIGKTGREMKLWEGACIVHEAFSIEKLLALYEQNPGAEIIAHPESEAHILKVATYIGSTAGMIRYVRESSSDTFIVATEAGILHEMWKQVPAKRLIPAPAREDNSCACSQCASMRLTTLEKVLHCLQHEKPEIVLSEDIAARARVPIQRMLDLSRLSV